MTCDIRRVFSAFRRLTIMRHPAPSGIECSYLAAFTTSVVRTTARVEDPRLARRRVARNRRPRIDRVGSYRVEMVIDPQGCLAALIITEPSYESERVVWWDIWFDVQIEADPFEEVQLEELILVPDEEPEEDDW